MSAATVVPSASSAATPAPNAHTDEPTFERRHARVAILGAGGYTGQEFIRLALAHPGLEIAVLFSREHAGRPVSELLPGIDSRLHTLPAFSDPDALESLLAAGAFDTLVVCLPHGAWREQVAKSPALAAIGHTTNGAATRIIDFSSDYRDGTAGYVYGQPEAFRSSLTNASRIANPGCYPTAALLATLPAAEQGWIVGPLMISALSGVSGAGRAPTLRTSFVELEGGAALYRAGTEHPHVAEIERNFARVSGMGVDIGFAPHLAPMARGILLTATSVLTQPVSPEEAHAAYQERYATEPFVRLLPQGEWPETRSVRTSNRCDVAVTTLHQGRTLLVAAALDNLVKGAAGQAIQNLNLMLGWPEAWGLPIHGTPW